MNPKKILIFITSIFFILLLLTIIIPADGIKITDNFTVKFISFEELINPSSQEKVDISDILDVTNIDDEVDSSAFEIIEENKYDSVMVDSHYVYYEPVPIRIDSVVRYIEFPDATHSSLNRFFEILANVKNENKIVRIMHYGDSQIETDRITDYFRYKLQTQFGGFGAGFVPAVKAYDFKSPMIHSKSGDWKRYTVYGRKDTTVKHRKYGMLGNFARFTPILADIPDTIVKNEKLAAKIIQHAELTISQSPYSFKPTKKYQRCKMFYGNNKSPFTVKVFADEQQIAEDVLDSTSDYSVKTWTFETAPENLKFEFDAEDSPDIYGFSLEGYSGINVDNIGMRGSGGLFFTRMDLNMLSRMYSQLNTKLLILQFGGNIVPGQREKYGWYRKSFSRQLRTIKNIAPDMTILVIGLADMSKKEDDIYVTYPNIPLIRDALKQASFENNCAYWDMYEAMGGENSMPSWVFHDPPLGEKDFIHFTPQGARYIAKMFYNAFMYEYNRYLRKR
ncbi:MAG: GDSL-type esterase/lipase family protein [Bacteroidales bacterium]|nr:GDSL-type esterase/lipase family protein [Bacteroidales bacterium]